MAQVTSADIRTRIKDMLTDNVSFFSSGGKVFDIAPMILNRANLPSLVITEANTTYDNSQLGARYINPTVTYNLKLYMQEWGANENNIDATQIDTMQTEIENLFQQRHHLADLKGVRDSRLLSASGIQPLLYPENQNAIKYVAKQWQLRVTYTRTV